MYHFHFPCPVCWRSVDDSLSRPFVGSSDKSFSWLSEQGDDGLAGNGDAERLDYAPWGLQGLVKPVLMQEVQQGRLSSESGVDGNKRSTDISPWQERAGSASRRVIEKDPHTVVGNVPRIISGSYSLANIYLPSMENQVSMAKAGRKVKLRKLFQEVSFPRL